MSKTLSIFFNIDRTYLTLVERTDEGLDLLYLNSTENKIDLENPDTDEYLLGVKELQDLLVNVKDNFDRLTVTLPAESVLVSKFPGKEDLESSELKKLIDFELRQTFPQFNYDDFAISITPLAPNSNNKKMILTVIIPNQIFNSCSEILMPLGKTIDNIEISQLNAHNAFMYNYPEFSEKCVALLSVQNQFIDISLIKNGMPAYYNLASFSSTEQIGEMVEKEFEKMLAENTDAIDGAYFFGCGLTKDIMLSCWETSMILGLEAKRLNAFRMMKTSFGKREREYCSRTMQLFPACIGGALPPYHKRIKLY